MSNEHHAYVEQYTDNIMHLSQQKGSKLRMHVREEDLQGRSKYIERLSATVATKKTQRFQPTPISDIEHSRRRVQPVDFIWSRPIDPSDLRRMMIEPQSAYVMAAVNAFGRSMDDEIIVAFDADAHAGQQGETTVVYDTAQDVAVGTSNLSVAKLRSAKLILDDLDVDPENRIIVASPSGILALTAETEVTSSDFNTQRVLVDGQVDTFLGFKFVTSTRLPKTGDVRTAFFYQKNAMGMMLPEDVTVRVDELPTLSYATQVFVSMSIGVVRVEEAAVGRIFCDETA